MEGALRLGQLYTPEELDLLVEQTYELRRDPKEREKENAEAALDDWIRKNQATPITIDDGQGGIQEIDLSIFMLN